MDRLLAEPLVLAVDVGGSSIRAAVLDRGLREVAATRRPSPRGPAVLDAVVEAAGDVLAGVDAPHPVRSAGVAMLGVVDTARGVCVRSVNLDLHDLAVTAPLTDRLGMPVALGHDVRAAAAAERRAGPAGEVDPLIVVIGTGIAAVAHARGEPIMGADGLAGELGHVVVRPGGPPCACGRRGCLEAVASAGAITRAYAARSGRDVTGAHEVLDLVDTDPAAAAVWDDACAALADGLLDACALLAPGVIVLGGGLGEAGDALRDPVVRHLADRAGALAVPPVRTAVLGARAGLVGAGLLALAALGVEPEAG